MKTICPVCPTHVISGYSFLKNYYRYRCFSVDVGFGV